MARLEEFIPIDETINEEIIPYKNNNFDILRFIAATFVLITHCYALSGNGTDPLGHIGPHETLAGIGVLIFFVISGFLVTKSLFNSKGILDFFKKRALRIYPALILIIALSALVLGPLMSNLDRSAYFASPQTWQYFWNISAIKIEYNLPGVFSDNLFNNAVNGSLWTLPLEVKSYIVLGLFGLLPIKNEYKIGALFGFMLLNFAIVSFDPHATTQTKTLIGVRYDAARYFYCFAAGSALQLWHNKMKHQILLAFALIIIGFVAPNLAGKFFFYNGLILATISISLNTRLPKIPEKFGDISYGLYLYAYPVQQILAQYKVHENGIIIYIVACFIITAILAKLSWELIEKPALRLK